MKNNIVSFNCTMDNSFNGENETEVIKDIKRIEELMYFLVNNECELNKHSKFMVQASISIHNTINMFYKFEFDEKIELVNNLIEITLETIKVLSKYIDNNKSAEKLSFYYLNNKLDQMIILNKGEIEVLNPNRPKAFEYKIKELRMIDESELNNMKVFEYENRNKILIELKNQIKIKKEEIKQYEDEINQYIYEEERKQSIYEEETFWNEMRSVGVTPEDIYD